MRFASWAAVSSLPQAKKISLDDFNKLAAEDHSLDDAIDEELRNLREQKDIVIDSRLGFYWIPESFKVYLDLDMDVATARIFKDAVSNELREAGEGFNSLAEVKDTVNERLNNEISRFKAMYGINPYNRRNFDLVINTSRHSPQTVALTVFDTYKKWLEAEEWEQVVSEVPMGYSYKN